MAVEPTAAEKVAQRLDDLRASVREAIQTSWALDAAHERALETVEQERKTFIEADLRIRQVRSKVHETMAIAITSGCVVGLFFLLIGDWTQKASTEVVEYFPKLIPNFSASTDEVYQIIETAVKEREVPGLECTRELWHEGGAVSAKREYLRIARERQCFEICAAPFGTGFFVSYRATILPLIIDPLGILLLLFAIAAALGVLVQMLGLEWGAITLVFLLCTVAFVMRTAVARGLAISIACLFGRRC